MSHSAAADIGYAVPDGVSLAQLLRARCQAQLGDPAVHIDGDWLSYRDLQSLINRAANGLSAAGVGRGDRVGALLPNNRAFLAVWLGAAELGATLVPINVNLAGDTLRYIVGHADLHTLIVDTTALAAYSMVFGEVMPAQQLFVYHDGQGDAGLLPRSRSFAALLAGASEAQPALLPEYREDPALIIYTSGTTGRPKGVVLSRAAQLAHGWYYGRDFVGLGPGETAYTCLPLFHVTSMGFSLGTLLFGAAIAIDARFSPFAFWEQVRRFEARMFPYVGAMIGVLAARPERPDDGSVPARRAIGSATPVHLWQAFERRFGLELIETYGQSELASLWFMPPAEGRRLGTVGKPAPRIESFVAAGDGAPAAVGVTGEIVIRPRDPAQMMGEYFRDPETTGRAWHDGWYWTGDAGAWDDDGYLIFRGRLKDFIRRRGENVSAYEVERAALSHPAVREAAAVGVPSTVGEEEIKLCVLLQDGARLTPAELYRFLRPRLAAFMQPRYIEFFAEFPRSATQRIQKFRLAEEGVSGRTWDRHGRPMQSSLPDAERREPPV